MRKILLSIFLAFALSSCSPTYVIRAGWEEAKILWKKEAIVELIEREDTEQELKRKLQLVLDARSFSEQAGLKPEGSFTEYTDIGREVLVWVLSASQKTRFEPYTWWFPVVGSVPYKGFFERDDADVEFNSLKDKGFDVVLKPSPAFSTLGWFNDPLLSTTVKFDDIGLVNTVIHEVLHNTIWIKNHVPFNESMANAVGSIGAIHFFKEGNPQLSEDAKNRLALELRYARFLAIWLERISAFYSALAPDAEGESLKTILEQREKLFAEMRADWESQRPENAPKRRANLEINNALLLQQRVYLDRIWLFFELYERSGEDFPRFIAALTDIAKEKADSDEDPFKILERRISQL